MLNKKPVVSVCVVTYNQERYIEQCLQSLVDQEVDFDFEIIVADDCSKDRTREIIERFAKNYPALIRPFFHAQNLGPYKNGEFVHEQAKGDYIAHMDGDDYALPGKLQVQKDFLDSRVDCNIVFHRVKILYENTGALVDDLTDVTLIPQGGYDRAAILRHITVGANSSKMYRASKRLTRYPDFNIVDYFVNVEQVGDGRACFVNEKPYGVYRANIGIASVGGTTRKALCDAFEFFAKKYPGERRHINAAASLLLLADLKNRRPTWRDFLKTWMATYHPLALLELYRHRNVTRMLRLPPPPTQ